MSLILICSFISFDFKQDIYSPPCEASQSFLSKGQAMYVPMTANISTDK